MGMIKMMFLCIDDPLGRDVAHSTYPFEQGRQQNLHLMSGHGHADAMMDA